MEGSFRCYKDFYLINGFFILKGDLEIIGKEWVYK